MDTLEWKITIICDALSGQQVEFCYQIGIRMFYGYLLGEFLGIGSYKQSRFKGTLMAGVIEGDLGFSK